MGLSAYRNKRDFRRTPEPAGGEAAASDAGRVYVVQKHAARRLHYDLRLEFDGVLLSWAVPAGPPRHVGKRALAIRTEDHPLEYATFEGVIPTGEYGGGTVMLWDRGRWRPEGDPVRGLEAGRLGFTIRGERLGGRWVLVRTGDDESTQWLLIRRRGGPAPCRPELAADDDTSVVSGRSLEQIGRDEAVHDGSARSAERRELPDPSAVPGARRAEVPDRLRPQLATATRVAPEGEQWLFELKLDGYRILAHKRDDRVVLRTRRGHDWTDRFPTVADAVASLPVATAILDGEVVVFAADGRSDFQALQNSIGAGSARDHVFVAFDLPYCDGYDLTDAPLVERKRVLAAVIGRDADGAVRYGRHIAGRGREFVRHACEMALEGAMAKRADARYVQRRTDTWRKIKCIRRQEFVVGGWTEPRGSRGGFGALLIGVHDEAGRLRYAGRVGAGFRDASLRDIGARLAGRAMDSPPFVDPPTGADARGVHWVRPELVVEVSFTEWTADGVLRHPTFRGLREDRDPREIRREPATRFEGATRRSDLTSDAPGARSSGRDAARFAGIRLSHPDRVLYPEAGVTKRQLAAYYESVAERVLPHVAGRPLTLLRCPRGRVGECFFQKHPGEGMSAPVRTVAVEDRQGRTKQVVVVDDLAGLITLVQLGTLEVHPWGSRADRPDRPDRIVLDLDPGDDVPWNAVVTAARSVRDELAEMELRSFVRTTGGKGLHVVVPIERHSTWPEVKAFAKTLAARVARREPGRFVLTSTKSRRQGRIYLDYLRNSRGATAIASYSTRARPGATVATPIGWDELDDGLDPRDLTILTVPSRVDRGLEPWPDFFAVRQRLTRRG